MMEAVLDGITRLVSTSIGLSACVWVVAVGLALPIVLQHKTTATTRPDKAVVGLRIRTRRPGTV